MMTIIWKPVAKESVTSVTLVFLMVNGVVNMLSKTTKGKKHTPKN